MVLQVLNYEKILNGISLILPDIETPNILFRRNYTRRKDERLNFNGRLTIKKNRSVFDNSVLLYPLTFHKLDSLLTALHVRTEYIGNFEGEIFTSQSTFLIGKITN
jgi:hypothetical protein